MQLQLFASVPDTMRDFERRFPKAVAVALTRTGWDVRQHFMRGMQQAFDRPTPFTMRAWRVEQANAASMEAIVWAAPLQARYLRWQIEGGERNTKGFEKRMHLFGGQVALPGAGAKLNQYGNMSLSFIKRVTSDQNTNGTARRFFVGTPKGWKDDGTFEGVWARVDDNNRLVRVMAFAEQARYKERFDASALAHEQVNATFELQLVKAIQAFAER